MLLFGEQSPRGGGPVAVAHAVGRRVLGVRVGVVVGAGDAAGRSGRN